MPAVDRTERVLQDVLGQITPDQSEQDRTQQLVERVVSATRQAIRGKGLDHVIAGSFTRNTWMKDKREFDIFIRFPLSTSRDSLEKQGLELGRQIARALHGRHTVAYAEHPYVRIRLRDYDVDVVPCYRVESATKIKSAVDRTPFHNEWLSRHFLKQFAPDVRLLKQFCKGQGIYGSDTKTQGLSGYLCELLTIQHRTFKNLARKASLWKAGRILINLEGAMPIHDVRNIHNRFPRQPLIVTDPVDPGRNVAAALSPENFIMFVRACRGFTERPSTDFFFRKPPAPVISRIESGLSGRQTRLMGFSCPAPRVIEDVLWPQLRRTARRVRDILEEHDFSVHGHDVWSDGKSCVFLYEMEVSELPVIKKLRGPSIFAETNSRNFIRKYKTLGRLWVEDEFWTAEVRRAFTDASGLLKQSLSATETELKSSGMASYLAREIAKSHRVMNRRDIIALARKNREFGQSLQDFLEKSMA
jgi:tRNA nucleotidyltransferase (CCA-adding enzyme)